MTHIDEKNTAKCCEISNNNALTKVPLMITPPTFVQTLFSPQQFFFRPNSSFPVEVLHNFHRSVTSVADKFVQFLHFSAAHNPFVEKILSFSSHLQNFNEVHCRSFRSLNSLSGHNFAAVLPGDSVAGIVVSNGILNFLNLYNTVLVVRLVLTWFPNTPQQIVSPLSTLCDPYLNIFRGIIPPLGGTLDLSPILAFLVLNAFTSAATALPAELPSGTVSCVDSLQPQLSDLTSSQRKWRKRLLGNRSSTSSDPN